MITAILIDDEKHCIDHLSGLLTTYCRNTVQAAGSFSSIDSGLAAIQDLQPGLVFLDVQIGDKSGFDLLRKLTKIDFAIIFTTAYEQYAVQAFKFSAIDYLLKPVDAEDLIQAIDKLKEKNSADEAAKKIETLFHNLKNEQVGSKRISIPTINGLVFMQVSDIVRCESNINYTTLFLKDRQKLVVARTLKEFETLLSGYDFYRVHNSHLINLACIKSYNKGKGGTVSLTDDSEVEVSTRRKEEFIKRITHLTS